MCLAPGDGRITGEPDGEAMKVGVAVTDLTTGMMAAFGITAALRHRDQTGEGQRVDLSLLETQVSWLANIASNYLVSGKVPRRMGNAHPNIVPYQSFEAQDRAMVVAVGNGPQFQRFCDLIGMPELAADPRYATNSARVAHLESLVENSAPVLRTRNADEWIALLWERGIPGGPINTVDRVFTDSQKALHLVQQLQAVQTDLKAYDKEIARLLKRTP